IKMARLAAAGRDHGDGAAPNGIAPPVQPEIVHLLRRSVAAGAVGLQNRLNVPLEIDPGGTLSVQHSTERRYVDETGRTATHCGNPSWNPRDYTPAARGFPNFIENLHRERQLM